MFKPVQLFADWVTYGVFGLGRDTLAGGAVNFFVFDTIKIFILLAAIIYAVSIMRTFLPPSRVREIILKKSRFSGHLWAAALGIVTPFCTCSAIPLFLGFIQTGIPLGVTFSFLVASPMINEVALIMLFGMFGVKIAALYAVSGFIIAVVAGLLIGRLRLEGLLEGFDQTKRVQNAVLGADMPWAERRDYAKDYTLDILKKVWPYVLIGIGIGAWIHGYVPQDLLARYAGADKWYAVPLATLVGIPLYSNAAGIIPLVSALTEKGVALGTTLAFMMAVTGLSLPEFMILRRVMKMKLLFIFFGIVGAGIMFTGFLFNFVMR
ncbi:MAG: permease [Elusimicrobiales bacterium]|nr:permease [Elusimicrobiales bacterium]